MKDLCMKTNGYTLSHGGGACPGPMQGGFWKVVRLFYTQQPALRITLPLQSFFFLFPQIPQQEVVNPNLFLYLVSPFFFQGRGWRWEEENSLPYFSNSCHICGKHILISEQLRSKHLKYTKLPVENQYIGTNIPVWKMRIFSPGSRNSYYCLF